MEGDYKVKLEVFEGPLDLLLYLIKQDEIDIYDISLERITRQYLEYLQAFKELNIELAGELIVMTENIIYLKSRSMLPVEQRTHDEHAKHHDPRGVEIREQLSTRNSRKRQQNFICGSWNGSGFLRGKVAYRRSCKNRCAWKRLVFFN